MFHDPIDTIRNHYEDYSLLQIGYDLCLLLKKSMEMAAFGDCWHRIRGACSYCYRNLGYSNLSWVLVHYGIAMAAFRFPLLDHDLYSSCHFLLASMVSCLL